jgi:hypothetical protein
MSNPKAHQRDEKQGDYMALSETSRIYGSWLPFLRDFSANAKALLVGFHREHLSLREQKTKTNQN